MKYLMSSFCIVSTLAAEFHLDFHLDHLQLKEEAEARHNRDANWEREFVEFLNDKSSEKENKSSGTVERNRDD